MPRTYQQALSYLYSFVDYSAERSYRYAPDVFDLSRVVLLLERLGNPHQAYRSLHVAGTKGKGSVSSFLAAALRQAGYRTGFYSSPHLVDFRERVQINGRVIPQGDLAQLIDELEPVVAQVPDLTMYEIVTVLAFLYFARQGVECAVIEVGLGGRLDATNVLHPLVSVITSLSYDHTHLLGDRLSDIAGEKAGIIKPGVPVVLAPQQHEAENVVARVAEERGSPLVRVGKEWLYAPGVHALTGQSLYIWSAAEQDQMDAFVESGGGVEWVPPRYEIPLLGYHQVTNCAVAYAALQVARSQGLEVPEEAIRRGFAQTTWPGRFQVLSQDPIVILDAAHNRDSALKLRIALDDYFPGQFITMVFGASADKDLTGMFDELLPRVARLIATQADHARAAEAGDLATLAHGHGTRVEIVTPVSEAVGRGLKILRPDEVLLVTGSLFVVGDALRYWESLGKITAPSEAEVPA
ncbi:MAG: bifunctional folylpolyglutamate synthase/dihydrofolate synthase [Anaerolineales bacterium]|nr:bifunctional folylpolyglutamate synthase/dihydrofolate synthase [Anaerolineales bacterium]